MNFHGLNPDDLELDTFRRGGVGPCIIRADVTDMTVRVKHKPTGITVAVGSEKSQLRNYQLALEQLAEQVNKLI